MKLSEGMYPDGRVFDIPTNIEPTKDQNEIVMLRCKNAYLRGKITVYEKFLKDKGFIKERKNEPRQYEENHLKSNKESEGGWANRV